MKYECRKAVGIEGQGIRGDLSPLLPLRHFGYFAAVGKVTPLRRAAHIKVYNKSHIGHFTTGSFSR